MGNIYEVIDKHAAFTVDADWRGYKTILSPDNEYYELQQQTFNKVWHGCLMIWRTETGMIQGEYYPFGITDEDGERHSPQNIFVPVDVGYKMSLKDVVERYFAKSPAIIELHEADYYELQRESSRACQRIADRFAAMEKRRRNRGKIEQKASDSSEFEMPIFNV